MKPIFKSPPTFKTPLAAILLCLVTLTLAQAQQSTDSKTESDWSADLDAPYTMTRASNREMNSHIAGKRWIGASAVRHTTAAKLGYYIAPSSAGKRPDRAFGGHHDKSERRRPSGTEGNGGDKSAGGEDAGGENGGSEDAGGGNADGGNAGGGNAGGRNGGDRNGGDRNGDASAGDASAGSGSSSDRSGDSASDASGGGNNGRGGRE